MKAKKDGVSLFLSIVTHAAAIITILCLLFIIAYILIRGIPNLTPSLFESREPYAFSPLKTNSCQFSFSLQFGLFFPIPSKKTPEG